MEKANEGLKVAAQTCVSDIRRTQNYQAREGEDRGGRGICLFVQYGDILLDFVLFFRDMGKLTWLDLLGAELSSAWWWREGVAVEQQRKTDAVNLERCCRD